MLYDFCPAAAHWYVRGVEPEEVFDVVWKAFEDYATGKDLRSVIEGYGLNTMLPEVRKYIDDIRAVRSEFSIDGPSPELTHTLQHSFNSKFGLQNQLNALGGSLEEFKHYIRVWAFLMRDWNPGIVQTSLRVQMPVWGWEVRVGAVKRVYLGLLVRNRRQETLRFALANRAERAGDLKWPNNGRPDLYALDRDTGVAEPVIVRDESILRLIPRWHEEAHFGRNRPVGLDDPETCHFCGYRSSCYGKLPPFHSMPRNPEILDVALEKLTGETSRERQHAISRFGKEALNA